MLPYIAFRADTKSYSVLYEHLSDMWLSTLEFGATQFYSCKEIAPKSPFLCVQAFPEWCAKAIRQLRTFPKAYLFPWMAHLNNKNNKHSVRHIMTTLREDANTVCNNSRPFEASQLAILVVQNRKSRTGTRQTKEITI